METPGRPQLRMKDLVARTGVGREAIRFYIKSGLLPEPHKLTRNTALYDEDHVRRVLLIKELQDERRLPLSVIKAVLDASDRAPHRLDPRMADLATLTSNALLGDLKPESHTPLAALAAETGASIELLRDIASSGAIAITTVDGVEVVDFRDVAIAKLWLRLRDYGFTEAYGYTTEFLRLYVEMMDVIAHREVRQYLASFGRELPEESLARLAEKAMGTTAELLGLLHTRAVLREVERNRGDV
jgi:DNA-binding transcriptional MerR regulator